ncbi:MAG: hypothetical protein IMF00_01070 [Proteobacteria bacterium]|jgi:hypothetical protein|nr:hypothetical protein [Pseudomonadota bacterium]
MSHTQKKVVICTITLHTLILALFLTCLACAFDQMPEESDFTGIWKGHTIQGDIPVDLTVAVCPDNSSTVCYDFHYGAPKSCSLTAEKKKLEKSTLTLVIKETSGGYCDKLWRGTIILKMLDEKYIDVQIEDSKQGLQDVAKLEKQR